jgi:hypothetical protein
MKPQEAVSDLRFEGEATGTRQTYYVFRGKRHFLVLSFKRDDSAAGNFNIIQAEAVDYAKERFRGEKGITAKQLFEESRRTRHFKDRFAALNTLYILAALGEAAIDRRYKAGALVFNIA